MKQTEELSRFVRDALIAGRSRAQIGAALNDAGWTEREIAWVDDRLNFKGRIERDGWLEQAKILAAGGETEFSKRK